MASTFAGEYWLECFLYVIFILLVNILLHHCWWLSEQLPPPISTTNVPTIVAIDNGAALITGHSLRNVSRGSTTLIPLGDHYAPKEANMLAFHPWLAKYPSSITNKAGLGATGQRTKFFG